MGDPPVGDASEAPYDADTEFAAVMRALAGPNLGGVVFGLRSNYDATTGANSITVQSGEAFVDGTWHRSTANVTLTANATGHVVLRKSWAAQTVRLAYITGAPTNNPGTTVEVALYDATVAGATVTLADVRPRVGSTVVGDAVTPTTIDYDDTAAIGATGIASDAAHRHGGPAGVRARVTTADVTRGTAGASDDTTLTIPIKNGQRWVFEAQLSYICTGIAEFQCQVGGSGTVEWSAIGEVASEAVQTPGGTSAPAHLSSGLGSGGTAIFLGSDNNAHTMWVRGSIRATADSNLTIKWGPTVGGGGGTATLKDGSTLQAIRHGN